MFPVESGVCSALDIARAHAPYLAGYKEEGTSPTELGALVPAPKIPLHSWEEEAAGGADEETDDIQLVDVGHFILQYVNITDNKMRRFSVGSLP